MKQKPEEKIYNMFLVFDKENKGYITQEEFINVIKYIEVRILIAVLTTISSCCSLC